MAANALAFLHRPDEAYEPRVVLTGVSYKTLNVDGRERLAQAIPVPELLAERVVREGLATEAAVISTCNRFEIVSVGGEGEEFGSSLNRSSGPRPIRAMYCINTSMTRLFVTSTEYRRVWTP